ncbi:MAG TPA: translation elongation factor Ts [Acidimicrobiales bacterium]|nr:translation elongation factor Ts [Acidimicrobiales bacterium]
MAGFSATDVKRLRDSTGAGMMDAKKALTENDGDFDAAAKWLREQGLAQTAKRSDRENTEGAVALAAAGNAAAAVELKSETDFVAKSPDFKALADDLAVAVVADGEGAVSSLQDRLDDLKVTLKENLEVGRVVRVEAADGNVLDTYLHVQSERGKNAVIVEMAGGSQELAHDVAVHIAFARPAYLTRDEFPAEEVEAKRAELEALSRNEGKPEAALPKIIEGRLSGFYKSTPGGALLEQAFVKDEKRSVGDALGDATVVRFAQIEIGA